MNRPLRPMLLAGAVLLLAACASTPYRTPDIGVTGDYVGTGVVGPEALRPSLDYPASDIAADPWWRGFGDAGLDRLVERVLERNQDLGVATLRVRNAQLQAGLARDARRPQLSGQVNSGYSRNLDTGESGGRSNSASVSASWELDLWNRLGLAADAAAWEAGASTEDREATALALVGTTVDVYWSLGHLNQRIAASEASLERAHKTLGLVTIQFDAGAVSRLELREATQSLDSQIATLASLRQQRLAARQSLALLLDGDAWPEDDEPQDLSGATSPAVDPGLPAELLGRRPDLRAAELRLRGTLANVDLTRRSFYPGISLTGSVGGSSSSLADVLGNPIATLGAGLSLPFLRFNERRLDIAVAENNYEIAVTQFRTSLLSALSDVSVALAARQAWQEQVEALTQSLAHALQIETLYGVRYRAGAVSLRTWLDAQESRRNAELSLAQARLSQLQNDVALLQSLGGSARAPVAETVPST